MTVSRMFQVAGEAHGTGLGVKELHSGELGAVKLGQDKKR